MIKYFFFYCLILFPFQFINSQEIDKVREAYHAVKDLKNIEDILNYEPKNNPIILAYQGAAETMKAQYVFSPIAKYRSFKNGSKKIEESIKNKQTLENTYLRLLVQLNAPSFLGYKDSIKEDIQFFSDEIILDKTDVKWKKIFVESILKSENKSVDLSVIKKIKL